MPGRPGRNWSTPIKPISLFVIVLVTLVACTTPFEPSSDGAQHRLGDRARQLERPVLPTWTFRASGNEPPWLVTVSDDALVLVTDYGARSRTFRVLDTEPGETVTRYRAADGGRVLAMTVRSEVCNDSMSGMPHPYAVEVETALGVLYGCGGQPIELLAGREWVVTLLDGQAPVSGARITLRFFPDDHQVAGVAACNHFNATYTLTGEHLRFSRPMSTLMACPEPVMVQEREFHRLLADVSAFGIDGDGMLELIGGEGRLRAKPLPLPLHE